MLIRGFEARDINVYSIFQTKVNCTDLELFNSTLFFLHQSVVTRRIIHVSILPKAIADLQNCGYLNYFSFVDSVVKFNRYKNKFALKTINGNELEEYFDIVKSTIYQHRYHLKI